VEKPGGHEHKHALKKKSTNYHHAPGNATLQSGENGHRGQPHVEK